MKRLARLIKKDGSILEYNLSDFGFEDSLAKSVKFVKNLLLWSTNDASSIVELSMLNWNEKKNEWIEVKHDNNFGVQNKHTCKFSNGFSCDTCGRLL